MKNKRKLQVTALILVLGSVVAIALLKPDKYHTPERIAWKNDALSELGAIDYSKGMPDVTFSHDGWFSTRGLLMADGSWIIYRSMCHKEVDEIYDIFIGRASDGRWYYSTYHFCVGAMTIMGEQPDSLEAFISQCALREFDGKSDDCLLPTWPPED